MVSPEMLYLVVIGVNFTLGVLGLFESVYRPKVENNAALLQSYVMSELAKTKDQIKLPTDPELLQRELSRLDDLNKTLRRPDDFLRWRSYLVVLLVVLGVVAAFGFYDPNFLVINVPLSLWSVVAFVLSVTLNGVFLLFTLKVDRLIQRVKAEDVSRKPPLS
ncbi:hypothetical protein MUP79_08480 [Candidatus Bathyarchaeota archaeon]|nr:hypothetical protein [Candidatus Bathyarchaeota archaeon]